MSHSVSDKKGEIFGCLTENVQEYFRFTEKDLIGTGGFGSVYRATTTEKARTELQADLPKIVAVKAVNADPKHTQHIIDEIKILKKLQIPDTLHYYGCFEPVKKGRFMVSTVSAQSGYQPNKIYIVTEYFEGEELWELLGRDLFSPQDKEKMIARLVVALHNLHEAHIIHRDIKPENIMLGRQKGEWNVRIIDYGLACHFTEPLSEVCNGIVGTPGYVDPHLRVNSTEALLKAADWWSMGQLIYNILFDSPGSLFYQEPSKGYPLGRYVNPPPSSLQTLPKPYREMLGLLMNPDIKPLERPSGAEIVATFTNHTERKEQKQKEQREQREQREQKATSSHKLSLKSKLLPVLEQIQQQELQYP